MSEALTVHDEPAPGAHPLPEPRGSEWTWSDLDALPDGGPKAEIVEGGLFVSPRPVRPHQYAAGELFVVLRSAVPADQIVLQEVDLELARNTFEPDIVVLHERAYEVEGPLQAAGVVLAVEVTSPSSASMDRIIKPAALAEAGVPNYWRVGLDSGGTPADEGVAGGGPYIEVYELDGRVYRLAHTLRAGTTTRLEQPFGVEIDPAILVRTAH